MIGCPTARYILTVAGADMSVAIRILVVAAMCSPAAPLTAQVSTASLDRYDIQISLFRPIDRLERKIGSIPFRFEEVRVSSAHPSVAGLLSGAKILPDFEAAALLFDMNPQLTISGGFHEQDRIRVIRIEETPELAKALSEGFFYKIHYDQELIDSLLQSNDTIQKMKTAASSSPASSDLKSCVSSAADDFEQIANHMKDGDQPLNHAMLSQVRGDGDLLLKSLDRITARGSPTTEADTATVCLVANDLQLKSERFLDARGSTQTTLSPWPMVRVIVNTKDAISGKPVSLLTIHCVPVALEGNVSQSQEFDGLSSPSERLLPEADYVFWATKGQEDAVLGRRVISVRNTGGPVAIDLGIKH
jgi:hypothetical protein